MNLNKHFLILFFICVSLNAFPFNAISLAGDSIATNDTLVYRPLQEVEITRQTEKSMTGLSVGKIVLNPGKAANLPSLLGNTNLLKLLELTPGVQNSGDANTNIYIRGGDAGQNLLLYDDAPLFTPGHLLGFFPLFNADHISSMEMIKSGTASRYGGRLSSILNVNTMRRIPEKTTAMGNIGLLSSQITLDIPIGERFGVKVSGRKSYIELLMQPILNLTVNNNAENELQDLDYRFFDTNLSLTGRLSERETLSINALWGEDRFGISDGDYLLNGVLKWSNALVSAQWQRDAEDYSFGQHLYLSSFKNKLLTNQAEMQIDLNSDIREIGYKNKYRFSIQNHPVELGLHYAYHNIQPQDYNILNLTTENPAVARIHAHSAAAYIASSLPITPALGLDWGIRYSFFLNGKDFHGLEPRLALHYRLKDNILLRASYDRHKQYLNMLNPGSIGLPLDFWTAASSQLPPQSGSQFTLGYYQSLPGDSWELSGELFYRSMSKLNEYFQTIIDRENKPYIDNVFIGKGKAYGLELMIKKNYGRLTGWLSYTLSKSERSFPELNEGKTFPARYDRRHDLSLVTSYSFNSRWDLSLVYTYATGNAYTLPSSWYFINGAPVKEYGAYNGARMPDYNRTDISLSYWFRKDNGLNLSIYNLFVVDNPIYIFLNVKQDKDSGNIEVSVKQKKLYTIMPSISWRFKF